MPNIPEEKLIEISNLISQGQNKEAKAMLQKLIDENSEHLKLKLFFADFLLSIGEVFPALNVLRQGMKIDSQNIDLRYLFGIAQIKAGRFNLGEKELEFAQSRQPSFPKIKAQLGWAKIMKGELEQGRKLLRELISDDITNHSFYLDLGVSFVGSLDFEEGFRWLETARHLNPQNQLILESISKAKESQKEFETFSVKDQKKARQARNDPQFLKTEAIKHMLDFGANPNISSEDIGEMRKELELAGFNPNFGTFPRSDSQPASKIERETIEYMRYHQKVPNVERKISKQEFENLKANLFNPKLLPEETKIILIALGHQGTQEAIFLLKTYLEKAPQPLKTFAKLALDECRIFSQENHSKFIPFSI